MQINTFHEGKIKIHEYHTQVKHIKGKLVVEKYLLESGLKASVLRPVAFFENLDGLLVCIHLCNVFYVCPTAVLVTHVKYWCTF